MARRAEHRLPPAVAEAGRAVLAKKPRAPPCLLDFPGARGPLEILLRSGLS